MVFRTELVKGLECPEVSINNYVIDRVSEVKYLGVHLCDDFSDDMSMRNCIRRTYARGNLLKRRFKHCTQEVKVRLFQSYCSSFFIVVLCGVIVRCLHTRVWKSAIIIYFVLYVNVIEGTVYQGNLYILMYLIWMFRDENSYITCSKEYLEVKMSWS